MDTKPIVLLDVDDVLTDFTQEYLDIVKITTGLSVDRKEVDQWDVGKALRLTEEQLDKVHAVLFAPGVAERLKPCPHAIKGVEKLRQVAHIFFVTSPMNKNPTWCHERFLWLTRHFGMKHKEFVYTSHKYLVSGHMFVDDKVENVVEWQKHNPEGEALLWETPNNKNQLPRAPIIYSLDSTNLDSRWKALYTECSALKDEVLRERTSV